MIRPKRLNGVGIVVRDIERSLKWYKEKLGFERLFDVSNGVMIGSEGVELWVAQVKDAAKARQPDNAQDVCIRLIGFEISEDDFARVKTEFPEDNTIVEVDHPKYKSHIIEDPDGHVIELFVDK